MDFAELRVFAAVARLGSMNRAARELNTVQSNVTARIQSLETELGVELFTRNRRGTSLTSAGQRMLPFVSRLEKLMGDAKTAAQDEGEPNGTLSLGSLETTMALRLGPAMTRLAREYPDVTLIVRTGTTQKVIEEILAGAVDGGFVAGPLTHPDLDQQVVFREEMALITPPFMRSTNDLATTAQLRTVVFQIGCSYRQRLETYLTGLGIAMAKPLEFGSLDAIIGAVSGGVGVTLLPKALAREISLDGRVAIHELPKDQRVVDTLFVRRRDGYQSSAMRAFLAMLHAFRDLRD